MIHMLEAWFLPPLSKLWLSHWGHHYRLESFVLGVLCDTYMQFLVEVQMADTPWENPRAKGQVLS